MRVRETTAGDEDLRPLEKFPESDSIGSQPAMEVSMRAKDYVEVNVDLRLEKRLKSGRFSSQSRVRLEVLRAGNNVWLS